MSFVDHGDDRDVEVGHAPSQSFDCSEAEIAVEAAVPVHDDRRGLARVGHGEGDALGHGVVLDALRREHALHEGGVGLGSARAAVAL